MKRHQWREIIHTSAYNLHNSGTLPSPDPPSPPWVDNLIDQAMATDKPDDHGAAITAIEAAFKSLREVARAA